MVSLNITHNLSLCTLEAQFLLDTKATSPAMHPSSILLPLPQPFRVLPNSCQVGLYLPLYPPLHKPDRQPQLRLHHKRVREARASLAFIAGILHPPNALEHLLHRGQTWAEIMQQMAKVVRH